MHLILIVSCFCLRRELETSFVYIFFVRIVVFVVFKYFEVVFLVCFNTVRMHFCESMHSVRKWGKNWRIKILKRKFWIFLN